MPKNVARDGAPKNLTNCPVHDGMYHMRNGQLIAGVSKTQAGHPVTTPTVEKRLAPVPPVIGQRPRTIQDDARLLPRKR